MSQPKISVVIPVYNTEKYVEMCVNSILNQTYKNVEIILVDDGSPDGSPALLDRIASEHENIIVVHKENGGLSSARNAGIDVMTGEYVVFLDSDDTLTENAINLLVEKIISTNSDAVFCDRYFKVSESSGISKLKHHFDKSCQITDPKQFCLTVLIGKCRAWRAHSLIYRSDLLKDNNVRFPEGYTSEDFPFNANFLLHANKIDFLEEPTVNYLKRKGSITTTFNNKFIDTICFIDKVACDFLEQANLNDEKSIRMKDSLFCRNMVTYLFSAMSPLNSNSYSVKTKFVKDIFTDDILKRFDCKLTDPYFDSKIKVVFYKIEYFLLKYKCVSLAAFLAFLGGNFKDNG